jgi:hypothetical protein
VDVVIDPNDGVFPPWKRRLAAGSCALQQCTQRANSAVPHLLRDFHRFWPQGAFRNGVPIDRCFVHPDDHQHVGPLRQSGQENLPFALQLRAAVEVLDRGVVAAGGETYALTFAGFSFYILQATCTSRNREAVELQEHSLEVRYVFNHQVHMFGSRTVQASRKTPFMNQLPREIIGDNTLNENPRTHDWLRHLDLFPLAGIGKALF